MKYTVRHIVAVFVHSRSLLLFHYLVLVKDLMTLGAKIQKIRGQTFFHSTLYENISAKTCSFPSNIVWQCVMPSRYKYLSWLWHIEAEQMWSFTIQWSRGEYIGHSGPLVGTTDAFHFPEQVYIRRVKVQIIPTHCREKENLNCLQIIKNKRHLCLLQNLNPLCSIMKKKDFTQSFIFMARPYRQQWSFWPNIFQIFGKLNL